MNTTTPQPAAPVTDQRHGAARAASTTHAWIWALLTLGYMLPWALAASRGARNSAQVFWVNLLLGWTLLGWVLALVMAFSRHRYAPPATVVVQNQAPATPAAPAAAPEIGVEQWAADPTGRHQLRFWDGKGWTERVMDGDTEATDAI